MIAGKEKLIPIFAIFILLIGTSSAIYVHATQINKDTITINGGEYTIDQLFSMVEIRSIETDEGEKTGIALDDLLVKVGVGCPSCHKYSIKAKDKYQQTVNWDVMKTGILTENSRVFFPDTAHSYWVRDVIEIEVK
jgi:hypothetical protein